MRWRKDFNSDKLTIERVYLITRLPPGAVTGAQLAAWIRGHWKIETIRAKAFVILDGTLLPIDRIAADTPYYSGKHKRHGMNVPVLTDPFGRLLWPRPRCPAPLTTSPPRASTGLSKPSLKRDSDARLTGVSRCRRNRPRPVSGPPSQ